MASLKAVAHSSQCCAASDEAASAAPKPRRQPAAPAWPPDIDMGSVNCENSSVDAPLHLCCPITLSLMRNPAVVATSGKTYEYAAIKRHHANGNTRDPQSFQPFRVPQDLVPNWSVRDAVEIYVRTQRGGGAKWGAAQRGVEEEKRGLEEEKKRGEEKKAVVPEVS